MRRSLDHIRTRVLPHGWVDLLRQIGLFMVAFLLYDLVRGLVNADGYTPFGNATKVINFERALHVFVEPQVQSWALDKHWLMDIADWTYLNGHFLLTLAALVFVYFRRNRSFYFVRNMFLISMGLALIGYSVFPTAPPRLMHEWGFTDSISQFLVGGTGWIDYSKASTFVNSYAAVPSMHVCFATMIGLSMARLVQRRAAKVAWSLYPLFVTFVVVVTANHYFTDVALGVLTAGTSAMLAGRLLARARPEVWAFKLQGLPA
jgi:ABC-type Co2+ transport system permease subunit